MAQHRHDGARKLYRGLTGRDRDVVNRRPGVAAETTRLRDDIASGSPTHLLAHSKFDLSPITLSEVDREYHMHVIGGTRQGKSRLMRLLMQGDIERGIGCCLLDPSEDGDTAEAVLRHCCSIGFEKVVYVNPSDFGRHGVPVINPIEYEEPVGVSVGNIKNALQILWNSADFSETPRIDKYLPATLSAIHASRGTLADIRFFLDNDEGYYETERWQLLRKLEEVDPSQYAVLRRAFTKKNTFENHYQPTVNRLMPFADPYLSLVFGSRRPSIPFDELIEEGWVILVNLDNQGVWGKDTKPQRALGTMVVNEVVHGVFKARRRGWDGTFHLYIDEVGDFATPDIPYVVDKKSKTGLRLTLAHQRFGQIKDENVLSSVRSIGNKVMFHVRKEDDRRLMMSDMGYGGKLPVDDIAWELGKTPKQEAVFAVNKQDPVVGRLVDVPDAFVCDSQLRSFKELIYGEYVWMHSVDDIRKETSERFRSKTTVDLDPTGHPRDAGRKRRNKGKNRKDAADRAAADGKPARGARPRAADEGGTEAFFPEDE